MANQAAFETGYQTGLERGSEGRLRQQALKDQELQMKIGDLVDQRKTHLANLSNLKAGTPDYDQSFNALRETDTSLRTLLHPDTNPGAFAKFGHILTDHLGVTNAKQRIEGEAQKRTNALAGDEKMARGQAAAVPLSLEQQSAIKDRAASMEVRSQLETANQLWDQQNPNATEEEKKDARYQNFQRIVLDDRYSQGRAASKPDIQTLQFGDGTEAPVQWDFARRGWTYLSGEMVPANLLRGAKIKPKASSGSAYIKGTMVKSKQSPTGFAQLYLDKTDPNKIAGWQPVTASRYYQGSTSSDVSTDSFGATTTSRRQTQPMNQQDVDLTKIMQVPESPEESQAPEGAVKSSSSAPSSQPAQQNPSPQKAPKSAPVDPSAQAAPEAPNVGKLIPNPAGGLPLDENMHIPEWTKDNPNVREKANELLDGVAMKDLGLAGKDAALVEALARKYGWGQGAYLPRELKQIQNADQFLDSVLESKAFMKALDSGFFQKWKMAEAETDPKKEGFMGRGAHQLAVQNLSPEQQEYVRLRQVMLGTISGLSSVVRTGRPTEATINRLAQEIPDIMSSASSKDAIERIKNIKREIAVALKQGVPKPSLTGKLDNKAAPEGAQPAKLSSEAVESLRKKLLQVK